MKGIKETEYAYMAGLFDGEGSFVIGKHFAKNGHSGRRGFVWELRMTIGMSEKAGLNLIKRIFNKKRLRESSNGRFKKMFYLTLYSNEIREVLPLMMPYIKVKIKQAKLLLKAVGIIKPKAIINIDNKLESMYLKMKILNNSRFIPI